MIVQVVAWIVAILVLAVTLAASVTAIRFHKPRLALIALLPILIGLLGIAFDARIPLPNHATGVIAALVVALIGIVAGNPITLAVLAAASKGSGSRMITGMHGGIIVDNRASAVTTPTAAAPREVLRGGTLIGYLERLALISAIVLGRIEIVAVLIAVKGLGRFSELDSAEVRERFIIGTLVSMVWAGACALLIVL